MHKLVILALLAILINGCEAAEVEKITKEISEKSADIQTSVTDTIEEKKIEAEKIINEKKNELIQEIVDDLKEKTDIDLNKEEQ